MPTMSSRTLCTEIPRRNPTDHRENLEALVLKAAPV